MLSLCFFESRAFDSPRPPTPTVSTSLALLNPRPLGMRVFHPVRYKRAEDGPEAGGGTAAIHDEQALLRRAALATIGFHSSCTGFFTIRTRPQNACTSYYHTVTITPKVTAIRI
jgi:hypothetical protein